MKQLQKIIINYGILILLFGCDLTQFTYDNPFESNALSSLHSCENKMTPDCLSIKTENYAIDEGTFTPVDIVFILDVSLSMQDNLQKISSAFSSLISYIKNLDWQMAFTTADHGDHDYYCMEGEEQERLSNDGQLEKYCPTGKRLFPQTPDLWEHYTGTDPKFGQFMSLQSGRQILDDTILNANVEKYEGIFQNTITRNSFEEQNPCHWPPYCQQNHEQPLRVLKSIISQSSTRHKNFFRIPATFVAFVITEEKERAEDPQNATTAHEVLREFSNVFRHHSEKKLIVYGISITNPDCLKKQNSWDADYSENLDQLVQLTHGSTVNICADDYTTAFSEISKQLKKYVNEIPLEKSPIITQDTPLEITAVDVNGNPLPIQWEINEENNSISFAEILKPGTLIKITYHYNKTS